MNLKCSAVTWIHEKPLQSASQCHDQLRASVRYQADMISAAMMLLSMMLLSEEPFPRAPFCLSPRMKFACCFWGDTKPGSMQMGERLLRCRSFYVLQLCVDKDAFRGSQGLKSCFSSHTMLWSFVWAPSWRWLPSGSLFQFAAELRNMICIFLYWLKISHWSHPSSTGLNPVLCNFSSMSFCRLESGVPWKRSTQRSGFWFPPKKSMWFFFNKPHHSFVLRSWFFFTGNTKENYIHQFVQSCGEFGSSMSLAFCFAVVLPR